MDRHDAAAALKAAIRSGKWGKTGRLPSCRAMAQALGISTRTLHYVLEKIQEEGLIVRKPRSGLYLANRNDQSAETDSGALSSSAGSRPDQIANSIIKDISNGDFRVGDFLPLRKELRFRYHASPPALQRALSIVEESGFIHRKGTHVVAGPDIGSTPSGKGRILVFANPGSILFEKQPWLKFMMSMEQHACPLGMRVEPSLSWDFSVARGRFLKTVPSDTRAVVCLIRELPSLAGKDNAAFRSDMQKVLRAGIPLIFFGLFVLPDIRWKSLLGPNQHLYLFQLEDLAAGKRAGEFGFLRGHKRIAYFSFSTENWNRQRFQGIESALAAASDLRATATHYHADFNKMAMQSNREDQASVADRILRRPVRSLLKGFEFSHPAYYGRVSQRIYEMASFDTHTPVMKPLFEQALKDRETTLWICADAVVASAASEFLENKGLQVPKDIHLMAIDDHPELVRRGITAQSFNWDRMGYMAVHAILGDVPIRRKRNRVVMCPHSVIDRGSVGRHGAQRQPTRPKRFSSINNAPE